uniref:Uncharacterized protein n=1 Tax=Romanomermis culicivorax TaxID=13658 RepID=A0A915HJ01_ROMCU
MMKQWNLSVKDSTVKQHSADLWVWVAVNIEYIFTSEPIKKLTLSYSSDNDERNKTKLLKKIEKM